MLDIVIVGAGGFGREVACLLDTFLPNQPFRIKGFLGKDTGTDTDCELPAELLGDPMSYQPARSDRLVLAIGLMAARSTVMPTLQEKGGQFLTLTHPTAYVAPTAELGEGVLVYPFATVSNNAKLADGVKLNYYASVGHDTKLGEYCLLAPYATMNGFATLEPEVYLSTHSTVAPGVTIGRRSKLSANSAAMNDVGSNSIVFGVPGRVVKNVAG